MSFRWSFGAILAVTQLLFCSTAFANYNLNLTPGVTEVSNQVYDLHMIILGLCTIIGIAVYSVMLWAIFRHRKASGAKAATFHESTFVEIIWTVIPFIILLAMAVPATKTLIFMENTEDADITIKITGYRWYWHYDYVHDDLNFYSYLSTPETEMRNITPKNEHYLLQVDKPLVLPVGKKVRFLITANDVLHSWWVPALGFKKDAIPGFINEAWSKIEKPGTYRGQCAELCGVQHGFMPIVVEALSSEDYDAWLEKQQQAKTGLTHNMMMMG